MNAYRNWKKNKFENYPHIINNKNPLCIKFLLNISILKGTLMQIWKFHYMFVFLQKQYPENFAFLILRINELFTRKVCFFLKK